MFSKLGFATEILSLMDLMFSLLTMAALHVQPPGPVHHLFLNTPLSWESLESIRQNSDEEPSRQLIFYAIKRWILKTVFCYWEPHPTEVTKNAVTGNVGMNLSLSWASLIGLRGFHHGFFLLSVSFHLSFLLFSVEMLITLLHGAIVKTKFINLFKVLWECAVGLELGKHWLLFIGHSVFIFAWWFFSGPQRREFTPALVHVHLGCCLTIYWIHYSPLHKHSRPYLSIL